MLSLLSLLLLALLGVTIATIVGIWIWSQKRVLGASLIIASLATTILIFPAAMAARENLRHQFYVDWYRDVPIGVLYPATKSAEWFNENAPNAKIAYSGFNFHYHLYGRDLQREVDHININDCQECRYVDFMDSPDSIRANPEIFTELYSDSDFHIYQINQ